MLNDFLIFENFEGHRVMQPLDLYNCTSVQLHAVGLVTSYFVDDVSDEDDDSSPALCMRTTPIRDIYVQYLEYDRSAIPRRTLTMIWICSI